MCTVSMVYDHYGSKIPIPKIPSTGAYSIPPVPVLPADVAAELRQLIAEFREAVAAAKVVDRLTDQPDCEDPAKASLEDRVARLERLLTQ